MFDRILFAKIGWSALYEGEDCTGEFAEPQRTSSWFERLNFFPGPDGRFYGFLPPASSNDTPPNPSQKSGWLVIFVSRPHSNSSLMPVGWYQNATFASGYQSRPEYEVDPQFPVSPSDGPYSYLITASGKDVYRIPAEDR